MDPLNSQGVNNPQSINFLESQPKQEGLQFADPDQDKLLSLVKEVIGKSRMKRLEKEEKLSPAQYTELEELKGLVNDVLEKVSEIQRNISEGNSDCIELKNDLMKQISNIHENYLSHVEIYQPNILLYPEIDEIEVICFEEMVLNGFVNRCVYEREIRDAFQNESEAIAEKFGIPIDQIKIKEIEIQTSETHNGGKVAAFVELENGAKFVYKPRDAKVDAAVIRSFREINNLDEEEKSASLDLPTYEIIHCSAQNGSIWEHVDGEPLQPKNQPTKTNTIQRKDQTLGKHVSERMASAKKKKNKKHEKAVKREAIRAVRMDRILSRLHVTDLHQDNVLIRQLSREEQEFVPIDLEVIEFPENKHTPTDTFLATDSLKTRGKRLTEEERKIIRKYREEIAKCTTRLIPLATQILGENFFSINHHDSIARQFIGNLEALKFDLDEDVEEKIKENMLLDYLNNDIPYFSVENKELYYGLSEAKVGLGGRG